jgi:hypothetical protein
MRGGAPNRASHAKRGHCTFYTQKQALKLNCFFWILVDIPGFLSYIWMVP